MTVTDVLTYLGIALVIAAITVLIVRSRYKNNGKGDEFSADDVSLRLTASNDTVISRNVVKTRIQKNNNGRSSSGGAVYRRK